MTYISGMHKNPRSHIEILGARTVKWSKFLTEDSQILGAITAIWRLGLVYTRYKLNVLWNDRNILGNRAFKMLHCSTYIKWRILYSLKHTVRSIQNTYAKESHKLYSGDPEL